jgi:hypothetical protein
MRREDKKRFSRWWNGLAPRAQEAILTQQPVKCPFVFESLDEEVEDSDGRPASLADLLSPLCDRNEHKVVPLTRTERMEIRDVVEKLPPDERELAQLVMRHGPRYIPAIMRWPQAYYLHRLRGLKQACIDRGLDRWPSETRPQPSRRR